ncbi:MAG TPA: hypothetical protein VLT45_11600, partial [Kofleriaceae bacterium]|nr:hypothetical protein [Kofleriaceae bacterium]
MTQGERHRVALSRTGRWALVRGREQRGIELVDLAGTMPNRLVDVPNEAFVEFVGRELWAVHDRQLARLSPADLQPLMPLLRVPSVPTGILATGGATVAEAVLLGEPNLRVSERNGAFTFAVLDELPRDERVIAGLASRLYVAGGGTVRAFDRGREIWKLSKPGTVVDVVNLFAGRVIAVWYRQANEDVIFIVQAHGQLIHQLAVPPIERWAVAEELGQAWAQLRDGTIRRIDLRYGRTIAMGLPLVKLRELAVDQDGRQAVAISEDDEVIQLATAALLRPVPSPEDADAELRAVEPEAPEDEDEDEDASETEEANGHEVALGTVIPPVPPAPPTDARATAPLPPNPRPRPRIDVPDDLPLAFGPPAGSEANTVAAPYEVARAHLDALLDLVSARTTVAIAEAWSSGRLSPANATPRPGDEVPALDGRSRGMAADQVLEARGRLAMRTRAAGELVTEVAQAGQHLPFPTLVRELELSPLAAQILLVASAPLLRGEIARLYGVLSNDPARPLVDRFLIEQLIAGGNGARRDSITRELALDAALVRNGLVQIEPAPIPLFARIVVPETLLDRLRGFGPVRTDDVSRVRRAETPLERLLIPPEVKRKLVLALAEPTP